jgi:hypothetical protein
MTYYTTGSLTRDGMIVIATRALREAGEPETLPNVQLRLPDDFDLAQDEWDGIRGFIDNEATAIPEPDASAAEVEPWLVDSEQAAAAEAEAQFAPATRDEAMAEIMGLQRLLAEARALVRIKTDERKAARERLSIAVTRFQLGAGCVMTQTELLKLNAREQQLLRIARANGELAPPRQNMPGPSAVDRAAFYSRGGSANVGHGPKWRRGAAGIESRGSLNHDPRRGPVAKLPSER